MNGTLTVTTWCCWWRWPSSCRCRCSGIWVSVCDCVCKGSVKRWWRASMCARVLKKSVLSSERGGKTALAQNRSSCLCFSSPQVTSATRAVSLCSAWCSFWSWWVKKKKKKKTFPRCSHIQPHKHIFSAHPLLAHEHGLVVCARWVWVRGWISVFPWNPWLPLASQTENEQDSLAMS